MSNKGLCWIHPHPEEEWYPGEVLRKEGDTYIVQDEYGQTFKINEKVAEMVEQETLTGVDDLTKLGDFNEGVLLHNIRERYAIDKIYTSIGTAILIAVNPYTPLNLYTKEHRHLYLAKNVADFERSPPHLFKMAELSYQNMVHEKTDQSLIVTGESGAGKTESTKIILQYLANLQDSNHDNSDHTIEQRILYTNPVLEAFGNAKTVRNLNSSRFGKFIQIYFDKDNKIHSADISNYLLEKSRIIMQSSDERNYHIFHMLMTAAPEAIRVKYMLDGIGQIPYVNQHYSDVDDFESIDSEEWEKMLVCMDGLQFAEIEKDGIFRVVAAVMHLGKLQVEAGKHEGGSQIPEQDPDAQKCANLLEISLGLLNDIVCSKSIIDPLTKKPIRQEVPIDVAIYNRETFAKYLYGKMFDWIVDRVNVAIRKKFDGGRKQYKSLGILDIFGFEIFDVNSFEQLCINYTNEKLQHHFNQHMFSLELAEYKREKIDFSNIEHADNQDTIDLIEGKMSIFTLLDDICKFNTGTDKKFLISVKDKLSNQKSYLVGSKTNHNVFGIAHFAGEVVYTVDNFVEKNKNSANKDVAKILGDSSHELIKKIFLTDSETVNTETVSSQFKAQLNDLMQTLDKSTSLYVRCIKPNTVKSPGVFESSMVAQQLRCAGMLEAIRIRRSGFPIRRKFAAFREYYKNLFNQYLIKGAGQPKEECKQFINKLHEKGHIDKSLNQIQIGQTKIFMKEKIKALIDELLEKSTEVFVVIIQKNVRMFLQRHRYLQIQNSIRYIQKWSRNIALRKEIKRRAKIRIVLAQKVTRQAKAYLYRKKIFAGLFYFMEYGRHELDQQLKNETDISSLNEQSTGIPNLLESQPRRKRPNFEVLINGSSDESESEEDIRISVLTDENISLRDELRELKDKLTQMQQNEEVINKQHSETRSSLESQLRDRDFKLKLMKQEFDKLKETLKAKIDEIKTLRDQVIADKQDDEMFSEMEQVYEFAKELKIENKSLKKQIKSFKKFLSNANKSNEGDREKDTMIKSLLAKVKELESDNHNLKDSQMLSLENSKIDESQTFARYHDRIATLEQENELCKIINGDLIQLMKFKTFEHQINLKQKERNFDTENIAEKQQNNDLLLQYEKLKQQEATVKSRMQENCRILGSLKHKNPDESSNEDYSSDYDSEEEEEGSDSNKN